MNSKISITSIEDFDKIVSNLKTCLNNIKVSFEDETKSINTLMDNPTYWSGKSRDKAYEKYDTMSNMYPKVEESLQNYINFLEDTSNRYKELEESTNSALENYSDELNVN